MASNYTTPSLKRSILQARSFGLDIDEKGMITLPDGAGVEIVHMVEMLCDKDDRLDYRFAADGQ